MSHLRITGGNFPARASNQERTRVDGPYIESKETIGGYFLISAPDLAEALEIGKLCPILDNGGTVEVRELQQSPQA